MPRPISGRRLAPKIRMTRKRMTISSGIPRPMVAPSPCLKTLADSTTSSGFERRNPSSVNRNGLPAAIVTLAGGSRQGDRPQVSGMGDKRPDRAETRTRFSALFNGAFILQLADPDGVSHNDCSFHAHVTRHARGLPGRKPERALAGRFRRNQPEQLRARWQRVQRVARHARRARAPLPLRLHACRLCRLRTVSLPCRSRTSCGSRSRVLVAAAEGAGTRPRSPRGKLSFPTKPRSPSRWRRLRSSKRPSRPNRSSRSRFRHSRSLRASSSCQARSRR